MLRSLLLTGALLLTPTAFAHGHHHHHDGHEEKSQYTRLAEQNFFMESGPVTDGSTSYILLPNGDKYPLDSKAIRALQRLEKFLKDEEPEPGWYPAPWQRLADFVEEAFYKPFWVRLTAGGMEIGYRDDGVALGLIGLGEIAEGAFLGHGFCKVVQTSCLFMSKHSKRFVNLIVHRKPLNRSALERAQLSSKQLAWNFKFWRAMRNIMISENLITTDRMKKQEQYFYAQEKIAFLLLQLDLAREAIDHFIDHQAGTYLSLRFRLAQIGKAMDKYSIYIAGLALSGEPIENEKTLAIDKKFQDYFLKWSDFIVESKRGSMPLTSPLGKAIWDTPRAILHDVRTLQVGECAKTLLSPDVEPDEEVNLDHALPDASGL